MDLAALRAVVDATFATLLAVETRPEYLAMLRGMNAYVDTNLLNLISTQVAARGVSVAKAGGVTPPPAGAGPAVCPPGGPA